MSKHSTICPLTKQQLIDYYFMENRNRVLDVAAFLDRLDRSRKNNTEDDFRLKAFRKIVKLLSSKEKTKVNKILMTLSDLNLKPLPKLDQKSASGATKKVGRYEK